MQNQKGISTLVGIIIIVVVAAVLFGGVFAYQYFGAQRENNQPQARGPQNQVASIAGVYKKEFASITVRELEQNKIKISGNAVWEGPNALNGQVNSGVIDGTVVLNGNKGVYKQDGCEIELTFVQSGLTAKDNNQCGGLNVSFTGEYIRFQESASGDNSPIATPAGQTVGSVISKNDLIGFWQNYPSVGAGFSTRYHFYPSGDFKWYISQMACSEGLLEEIGKWEIKDGKLVLSITKEATTTGPKSCGPSGGWQGQHKTETLSTPKLITLSLFAIGNDTQKSPYPFILIGSENFYKLNADPTFAESEELDFFVTSEQIFQEVSAWQGFHSKLSYFRIFGQDKVQFSLVINGGTNFAYKTAGKWYLAGKGGRQDLAECSEYAAVPAQYNPGCVDTATGKSKYIDSNGQSINYPPSQMISYIGQ